jgi:hypothetical protein
VSLRRNVSVARNRSALLADSATDASGLAEHERGHDEIDRYARDQ